jgi:AraC-like DNA-binding protein
MGQEHQFHIKPSSVDDLQDLPQKMVSYVKRYRDGYISGWHAHARHQLIYATEGLMLTETPDTRWVVPAGYGFLVPAETPHRVVMAGEVHIRTLYIRSDEAVAGSGRVAEIPPLLAGLIGAFCAMENRDAESARAFHLTQLILMELAAAPAAELALPMPRDARLQRVCAALAAAPEDRSGLDHWAGAAGMSRRSFTRAFQADLGMSFGTWQQRMRGQHALRAIADGTPPDRVARSLGYASKYALEAMLRRQF